MTKSVWATLSAIDCNKHTEKKGQLTYLSWTWAWQILMEYYPSSSFEFMPEQHLDNGTVMTSCSVTVEGITRSMWLPVMDNKNKSILVPTSREISDARMRCLAKCIALHGLGLYIYAGEDLPQAAQEAKSQTIDAEQFQALNDALDSVQADKAAFCKLLGVDALASLTVGTLEKAYAMIEAKRKSLEKANVKS